MTENLFYILASISVGLLGTWLFYIKSKPEEFSGKLKSYYGESSIYLGPNKFSECKDILIVGNESVISVRVKKIFWRWSKLLLNLKIFDESREIIAEIVDNEWTLNRNNFFKKDIKRNKIKIFNKKNEVVCEVINNKNGMIAIVGIFYINGKRIEVTEKELVLPGNNKFAGCHFSNCGTGIKID